MKKRFIISLFLLVAIQGILVCSYSSAQNVGIGTASPSEKLDVLGNLKFSGALMPNNNAGTVGRLLQSAGAGAPPTWGPALLNPGANNGFGKFYSTISWSGQWTTGTTLVQTITDAGLTNASAATVSIDGPWNATVYPGIMFKNIVCEAGQMRVSVLNNTGGNLTGAIPIAIIIFY
jgi:hypothetical protein